MSAPSDLLAERVELLLGARRYREALSLLHRRIAAGEENAALWLLVARAHIGLEEWPAALDAAAAALRLDPAGAAPHLLASTALLELGRASEAYAAALEATRRAPDHWPGHYAVAAAAVRLADRRRNRRTYRKPAEAAAGRAVLLAPDEAMAHVIAGVVAMHWGRTRQARAAFTRALQIEPQNEPAHFNLGLVKIDRGNLAAGVAALSAAGRANPQEPVLWDAFDVLVRRWLVSVHVGFFVLYQLARLTGDMDRPGQNPAWVWIFAGATVLLVGWTWYSFRGLAGRAGAVLMRVLRGWPATAVWLGALCCAYLATAVLCLTPSPDVRLPATIVALVALLTSVVVSWTAARVMTRRLAERNSS